MRSLLQIPFPECPLDSHAATQESRYQFSALKIQSTRAWSFCHLPFLRILFRTRQFKYVPNITQSNAYYGGWYASVWKALNIVEVKSIFMVANDSQTEAYHKLVAGLSLEAVYCMNITKLVFEKIFLSRKKKFIVPWALPKYSASSLINFPVQRNVFNLINAKCLNC